MPKIHLFIGPPFSGKTEALVANLEAFAPFDYLFIGSQGEFVKHAARLAIARFGVVNRTAFKAVDQVAVEAVLRQKKLLFADEALKLSVLSQIVEDMAMRNLDVPEELAQQAAMIRHRSSVEKLLSLIDDVKTYMKEEEFRNPEDRRDIFISTVIENLQRYFEMNGLFDTYDAYRMVADGEVEVKGKALFIDGFYDFTPVISAFFKAMISKFDHIYIAVTTGEPFERGTVTILKTLEEFKPVAEKMDFNGSSIAKGLFFEGGNGLKIYSFEKMRDEVKWVCGKVKSDLLKGEKAGNVEIVVKSSESPYVKALCEKFREYGVKASYLAKKKLSQNVVIQQLMLPLRVVTNGYPPDLLTSMVMIGYAGQQNDFNLVYDLARLNRGPMRLSHEARLKNWLEKLENYSHFLSKKEKLVSESDEEFDRRASLEEISRLKKLTRDAVKTVKHLFEFLEKFERARSISNYTQSFKKAIEIVRNRGLTKEDETAVKAFEELLWQIEGIWNFLGKERLTPADYRFHLELRIKEKFYTPSEDERTVRISDILTSRFTFKPLKIFVGFNEGIYPSFRQNYFYTSLEEENHFGQNRFLKSLSDERIDLYVALSKAKKTYLTFPTSSKDGSKLLPSLYTSELIEKFNIGVEKPDAFPPMSVQEAVLAYSKWSRNNGRSEKTERKLGVSLKNRVNYKLEKAESLKICEQLANTSVSFYRFQTYEDCPLKFFFSYVLKLPGRFSYTFDLNVLEIGNIYHNVMKELLGMYTRDELARRNESEVRTFIERLVRKELMRTTFLEEPLFNVEVLRLTAILEHYIWEVELVDIDSLNKQKNEYKYLVYKNDKKEEYFTPYRFEYPLEGEKSKIDGVSFRGRIDRIDVCNSGIMIVDYKSRNFGNREQLYIYSAIAEKNLEKPVLAAAFAAIEKEEKMLSIYDRKKIRAGLPIVMENVKKFLQNVKNGDFNPTKERKCSRCDYNTICPEARG